MGPTASTRFLAVLPVLLVASACSGSMSAAERMRADVADFAAAQHALMMTSPGEVLANNAGAKAYPSKVAIGFLSFWRVLGQRAYYDDAIRQGAWARSQEDSTHLIHLPPESTPADAPGLISSYAQSSLALGYWFLFKYSGDTNYLTWADDVLTALLGLPTVAVCWADSCYPIWYRLYGKDAPHTPYGTVAIDPNQCAGNGLLLTLLLNEPGSRYFNDSTVAAAARANLDAAVATMDASGRIPLATDPANQSKYDTDYGAATLFRLAWSNLFWHNANYALALRLGAAWQYDYSQSSVSTLRYLPQYYAGPLPDPTEAYRRLGIFYFVERPTDLLRSEINGLWGGWDSGAWTANGYDLAPFVVLEQMGLPPSQYWYY